MHSGRCASIRRKRPFPSSSPHSAQTESLTIQKTTISSCRDVFAPPGTVLTDVGFVSIGKIGGLLLVDLTGVTVCGE